MSLMQVDANYRFIAASNELNARIAQRQQALSLYITLVLGFPVASLCLVFLNYKTERALTNLRSYNTDPRWSVDANRARRFHDYTAAILVATSNAVAIGALWRIYPAQAHVGSLVVWLTGLVTVGAVFALLWMPRLSYRPIAD